MSINSINGNTVLETGMFPPCRLAATGPITLSGLQTIDGVPTNAGDRVLVMGQADATTNGIYAASSGTWVRTTDAQSNTSFFDGMAVTVAAGNVNAGQTFLCTCPDDPVVIGTSLLTFGSQSTLQIAQQMATSTASIAIGIGTITFTVQAGRGFMANQWVTVYETSNSANAMLAQVTSYAGTSLVLNAVATGGGGTHADWTIVLANSPASAGILPPIGSGNVTGPGSSTAAHLAMFADGTGKVLSDSGVAAGALAGRTTLLYGDAGTATIPQTALVPGSAPLPYCGPQPNDNLHLLNNATNATRDINVTPGRCRDDTDATNLHLAGTMVKRLDSAWAAGGVSGAPAGACDSGSKGANQTWHVFLIAKRALTVTSYSRTSNVATVTIAAHGGGVGGTVRAFGIGSAMDALAAITAVTTNTVSYANAGPDIGATAVSATADLYDILASQNYVSPALPSGWTVKQSLGSFLTDGAGSIRAMLHIGDRFFWTTIAEELSSLAISGTAQNFTLKGVPSGLRVFAHVQCLVQRTTQTADFRLYPPDFADVAIDSSSNSLPSGGATIVGATGVRDEAALEVLTNESAQLRVISSTGCNLSLTCVGWRDPRRRLF